MDDDPVRIPGRSLQVEAGLQTFEPRHDHESIDRGRQPAMRPADPLHLALASHYRCDFLVTWNCRHLANAEIAERLEEFVSQLGFRMPALCTPEQLMGS